jgi:hypothetical protein
MGKQWSDPAQTERQLRSVRCYSEAKLDGRIFEGVALERVENDDSPDVGFLIEEIFQAYGGQHELEQCLSCKGNVVEYISLQDSKQVPRPGYAGCHELLTADDLSPTGNELDEAFDEAFERALAEASEPETSELFLTTSPRWYGLWNESPLTEPQLQLLASVFEILKTNRAVPSSRVDAIDAAVKVALKHSIPLRVRPEPAGKIDGNHWTVLAHCSRCLASWQSDWKKCEVCQQENRPIAERVRRAKGNRPYWRLGRFLGSENVPQFLERWRDSQSQRRNEALDKRDQ